MDERSAEPGTSAVGSFPRTCSACGSELILDEWCPIRLATDDGGTTHLLSFCDEACERAWEDR